ncbi:MAG: tRNA threonylcarbamoyladenosine dehydratase [Chthoniobacteraceae bacterium]
MMDGFEQRFGGVGRLWGRAGLERLRAAHVAVVGLGGVGSWTVEALARSGVGALTLIDLDDVCITNVNRQLPAIDGQIGRPKAEVLAKRVTQINPECRVHPIMEFLTASNAEALLGAQFDQVVDAIDNVTHKCALIVECRARNLPVVTIGGAGGKRDGSNLLVRDLAFTGHDDLLRQVRKKLRREHGFPGDVKIAWGVPAVYSAEKPVFPHSDGTWTVTAAPGSRLTLDCESGFGTAAFVTGAFGLAAAGEVVRRIAVGTAG